MPSLGTITPSFRPERLDIACTGALRAAHAVEIAELLRLARDYYCYGEVRLRFCAAQVTTAAAEHLKLSLSDELTTGMQVSIEGPSTLRDRLLGTAPKREAVTRSIGFRVNAPTKPRTRRRS